MTHQKCGRDPLVDPWFENHCSRLFIKVKCAHTLCSQAQISLDSKAKSQLQPTLQSPYGEYQKPLSKVQGSWSVFLPACLILASCNLTCCSPTGPQLEGFLVWSAWRNCFISTSSQRFQLRQPEGLGTKLYCFKRAFTMNSCQHASHVPSVSCRLFPNSTNICLPPISLRCWRHRCWIPIPWVSVLLYQYLTKQCLCWPMFHSTASPTAARPRSQGSLVVKDLYPALPFSRQEGTQNGFQYTLKQNIHPWTMQPPSNLNHSVPVQRLHKINFFSRYQNENKNDANLTFQDREFQNSSATTEKAGLRVCQAAFCQ